MMEKVKDFFNEYISQPFNEYIYQPTANFCNKIMGRTEESSGTHVTSEVSTDFSADQHNIPPSGDDTL